MFGFFGRGGNKQQQQPQQRNSSTPTKSTAEYEPPLGASSSPSSSSSITAIGHSQHQEDNELFGGMTVHSNNYGNTSTYSTSSGSSARLSSSGHKEISISTSGAHHDTGSSFSFLNDDDTSTTTTSATTPQDEVEHVQPVSGQMKINRSVGKGRRKNPKTSKVDDELKQLEQTTEDLDRTYSMAQKTFSNIENNINKVNHFQSPPIQSIETEEDDSTISSFLKSTDDEDDVEVEPPQTIKPPPVVEFRKSSSPSDDISFASLQVKPRRLDRGNSSSEVNSPVPSATTPVNSPPTVTKSPPVVKQNVEHSTTIKEEKSRRESFKSESIEEEKEVVDNDWTNIKSSINSSLTKYSTRISKFLDEEQKKMDKKRENQFSLLQEKIQSLEQLLDKYTESEEFEEAEKVEQELTVLRSKVEEIQVKEKNNDSYILAISKTLTEMKKEINLVYSRVDFSFTTTKKDYDDFLKKNNPLKELRRERLESETNRIKRMGESINLEENEFQKRKSRITDQIDSSTKDLRIQEADLMDHSNEISIEIAELERKLKEKRAEQKIILSQLDDVTDKIKKYEEDFNDQLKLISYDEEQFQKRKNNYLDDVESFEKLSTTLNKDLTHIEAKETKKYDAMMDKRQYKDYLQTQQVRVSQIIELVDKLDKLEDSPGSPNDNRAHIIKELGALTQQLSTLKSHLSSISLELDSSTQQLQRANDRLPKVQSDKLEYAKARKFKEAAQCKEESDKLTKLIQDLESSIPTLKQEHTQLEEQRIKLTLELDDAHNKLEQVDKVDSKRFITLCFKRIDFLEKNRAKLLEVETPEQLKLRFDVIDELISLFTYQVRQLKAILSLSDDELIQMKKLINSPVVVVTMSEEPKVVSVRSPTTGTTGDKTKSPQTVVNVVKVVEEILSPKDKLVKLESNLEELKQLENTINNNINDAVEKEEFDMCEVLDQQLEETKMKISNLKVQIEELKAQIPADEEPKVVVVEEEETVEEAPKQEPEPIEPTTQTITTTTVTAAVVEEPPQQQQHNEEEPQVEEYQSFNDGNELHEEVEEEPSSFEFIGGNEEPTSEEEQQPAAVVTIEEEPKQEEEESSSFDFIESEEPTTEQVPIIESITESEPVPEEEKSSFDFIAADNEEEEEKTENQESGFGFINE